MPNSCALNRTQHSEENIQEAYSIVGQSLTKRSSSWSRTSVETFIKDFEYQHAVGKSSQYHAQVYIVERALVGTKFDQLVDWSDDAWL